MNAMEFINDEYASWDITYFMNGALLNRIPLIKKLKWREVFSFRGMFGHLTDKNNPYIGEQNEGLFLFPQGSYLMDLRLLLIWRRVSVSRISLSSCVCDYVWRLTYKDHPGIQTKGIRFL